MITGTRRIGAAELILTVGLALFAALCLVYGAELGLELPAGVTAVLLGVLSVLVLASSLAACRASLRAGGGFTRLGSAIVSAGILMAVLLPGAQLLVGARRSRMEDLGFPTHEVGSDLGLAFLLFSLALLGFYAGEVFAEGRRNRAEGPSGPLLRPIGRAWESRTTYGILIVVGLALIIVNSAQSNFEDRGLIEGQGAIQLFGYAAPLGIAVGILNRHWGSRLLALVSIGALAYLISGGIRSPLLIVAAAVAVRYLYSGASRRIDLRQVITLVLAVYLGAVMLVALSVWRGQRQAEDGQSFATVVVRSAESPFGRLQQQGLDTVDGLILSTRVDRDYVDAEVTDPLKIATGFIPHQIWPEKPPWLGATVTQQYTNFGAGGIFLSGPGYTLIVFGTAAAVPVLFLLLGFFSESIFRRMIEPSIWTVLLAYFLLRFSFAGDAFDAFHVVGLCIVMIVARTLSGAVGVLQRQPGRRQGFQRSPA
jgi:hypothetical protein